LFLCSPIVASSAGNGFEQAIDSALPRVVKLYGVRAGQQVGYGSGILVSGDGLVLTVFSILVDAPTIRAVDANGRRYEAALLRRDFDRQLALLRLKSGDGEHDSRSSEGMTFPYFDLTIETTIQPGEWTLAAGNAFKVAEGAEPVSLAHGVFSTRTRLDARRRVKDFPYRGDVLVIDAVTSNPGASGSALVNLQGDFLGMIGRAVTSNLTHTHLNYAIPRDVLLEFVREVTNPEAARIAQGEEAADDEAWDVGIRLTRVGYRDVLPFVEKVRRDSPAARAGVRPDDLIITLNGRQTATVADYDHEAKSLHADEPVDLVVRRGERIVAIRLEPEKK